MNKISIDPITRMEGHGRIEIFLDDAGNVANAYFQVPELRGFEHFCLGRLAEDMPVITSRICGVCPEAHHLAAIKCLDDLFQVTPPPAAQKIRELFYMAFYVTDHTTHFYILGGPDFIMGPDAPPAKRNIFGVIEKVGLDIASMVISCRKRNHEIIRLLGGRSINPTSGLPGGWSVPISKESRDLIEKTAKENIDFALFTLKLFEDIVLKKPEYLDMILSDTYLHKTYYMGMVDQNNRVNFYDGKIRVVDPEGTEFVKYAPKDYATHIAERVEPWTTVKFAYLRGVGWNGFSEGKESGVYCATPLARLNVSDGMATPSAQEEFEKFYTTFGSRKINGRYQPVHYRLATHWARLIELLYASERMLELAMDPEITSPHVRTLPSGEINPAGAVGAVEAPRGTLTHHYMADESGVLTMVNLVVGTTNNLAPISMSIKRAAEKLINGGKAVTEPLLNRIEMAFRLYDPCFSCATHSWPGKMPLIVTLRNPAGETLETYRRD